MLRRRARGRASSGPPFPVIDPFAAYPILRPALAVEYPFTLHFELRPSGLTSNLSKPE